MPNRIPLTQGQVARVDASDHAWLSQWRWRYATNGYAIRTYTDRQGQPRYALMHRVIMQARPGELVDHIDGNRLNNRPLPDNGTENRVLFSMLVDQAVYFKSCTSGFSPLVVVVPPRQPPGK
jgi:hypothetical protein